MNLQLWRKSAISIASAIWISAPREGNVFLLRVDSQGLILNNLLDSAFGETSKKYLQHLREKLTLGYRYKDPKTPKLLFKLNILKPHDLFEIDNAKDISRFKDNEIAGYEVKPNWNILKKYQGNISSLIDKDSTSKPVKSLRVTGLFSLSEHPYTIFYEGKNPSQKREVATRGPTQIFAILRFVAEKYKRRNRDFNKTSLYQQIRISFKEIEEILGNQRYCNKKPDWKGIFSSKDRLKILKENIIKKVAFTPQELSLETFEKNSFLVFYLR